MEQALSSLVVFPFFPKKSSLNLKSENNFQLLLPYVERTLNNDLMISF
ncbi:hypothetical protein LEP1GSC127_2651 [Leptospira kirschneri str. 200801925]|uniref:Uncharacterized protein n=1 Tax=Leptospira kirschneri str. 200802841 TaxID=1193047 RepID=A0A828Y4W1_9LEPT|nr:hypothetical protein LEP1GSC131_2815 [Leptospira kirschneri str. 200802841]EMO77503.1 hypothetical protein LEP1GSC127_2651 [Leptospira kirschneri str. 200801925]